MSCARALDGVWCKCWREMHRDCTRGTGMQVRGALVQTCGFACVRWNSTLHVFTRVGRSMSMCSLVRCE